MLCRTVHARNGLVVVAIGLALISIIALVSLLTDTPRDEGLSAEFYMLVPGDDARSYLEPLRTGVPIDLIVGVVNRENEDITYRVEARLAMEPSGLLMSTSGPATEAFDQQSFIIRDLPHGAVWEHPVALTALEPRAFQRLDLMLFSPLLRDGHYLHTLFLCCGSADIEVHESDGTAVVTLKGGNRIPHDCRIEAWQNGRKVAEMAMRVEIDETRTWTLRYPVGETQFRLYDGDILALDDSGAERFLQFWVDVIE